ncbi:MAG: hypothetical protein EON54_04355, partial [Alcaligenaceae bacterium]
MKAISGMLVPATVTAVQATRTMLLKGPCLAVVALILAMLFDPADAATSASQAPLYTGTPGAKPNLMFVLDNSNSMASEAPDDFLVYDNCPASGGTECHGYSGWFKMRSSSANSQYYNPAVTYKPRLNPDGTPQTNPLQFVDNQTSYKPGGPTGTLWQVRHDPKNQGESVPAEARFTYVRCTPEVSLLLPPCSDPSKRTVINIDFSVGSGSDIPLPMPNNRTDAGCSSSKCSTQAELDNILNWYQWYRTRLGSVQTAMGQAMLGYENKFRVGYSKYSEAPTDAVGGFFPKPATPGVIASGVRYFKDDPSNAANNWKTQFYKWLYEIAPEGGTPSHAALSLVADYYAGNRITENGNPWKNDPTSTQAEGASDLSCRRSYAIVLSDGAWNPGSSRNANQKFASISGPPFSGNPSGKSSFIQYNPAGASGYDSSDKNTALAARNLYIPYSDGGTSGKGFADLTARYFWHTDFSTALPNNVPPVPGQHNPTFWQNLTTFTIGYGLTPSGQTLGMTSGLTWDQINQFKNGWLSGGSPTRPEWAKASDLNAKTGVWDRERVDDFIRAGFTGGGRAFSVYSAEDVRRAIDNVLSGIVGSGSDAGVAVSGNSGDFQSLNSKLKYTTEYETSDNSGDIKAFTLDANGGYANLAAGAPTAAWSANVRKPALDSRKIFTLSNYDASMPSSAPAKRLELTSSTGLATLPPDFKLLLNANNLQKLDSSFIRYM